MFAYNPQTQDMSGQIVAQGMTGAAQAQSDMMNNLGQNIGGALLAIGNMYGEREGNKAKGRAFKDMFKVIAPSAGIDMKQLEALTGGSLKNDLDWYNAQETVAPLLPSLINARLVTGNMGIKQQGQQIQQRLPELRAQTDANNKLRQEGPAIKGTALPGFE